jgi:hypothetical protein
VRGRSLLLAGALSVLAAAQANAQGWTSPDPAREPWNTATLKLGPLFVAPSFDLRNVGIDNNVFRDPANPAQDLTATIAVSTLFGAHVKAFSVTIGQDNRYLWFRRYTSERSIDGGLNMVAELRLRSIRPWVTWSKMKSHERAGFEIDTRASRESPNVEAGTDITFGLRTGMTVAFRRERTVYQEGQTFDGVDLKTALDNRFRMAHVNGRWAYTEITDVIGGMEWSQNTFDLNPLRSASTLYYFGGFQTHGDAPILGRLQVGYKRQQHENPEVPDFKGLVLNGTVTTVALDRLKLELAGDRDLSYSYDDKFPFYVQQGGGLTVTGRLSTRFDAIVGGRAEWLDYSETFLSEAEQANPRTDLATTASVGFMYRLGGTESGSHFGLTFERAQRTSPIERKNYRNNRVLTNIKFNF